MRCIKWVRPFLPQRWVISYDAPSSHPHADETQLQKEADRAETAEKSLLAKSNVCDHLSCLPAGSDGLMVVQEVSALRQTTFNLESSLKTANEKLKKEEKETQRLQYGASSPDPNHDPRFTVTSSILG
jgi:hypothetical protein